MPKDFLSGGFQNNSGKSRNFYKLSVPAFRGNFPHKFSGIFLERKIRFFPIFFSDCSCNENLWVFFGKKIPPKNYPPVVPAFFFPAFVFAHKTTHNHMGPLHCFQYSWPCSGRWPETI